VLENAAEVDFLPLRMRLQGELSDDELLELCALNELLRIERTADGELEIMPPEGGESGRRGFVLGVRLGTWAEHHGGGVAFGSSTGFILPNRAMRAPDAAWVRRDRWNALTQEQRDKFPPLCPDFVAEIASPTDRRHELQAKMREYMANGARLGWLLDPLDRSVTVFRPDAEPERLVDPDEVSGDPVLPAFVLRPRDLW
jgi:Uma2 family endonuclease